MTPTPAPSSQDAAASEGICSDCPPPGYPTDATRCAECPRRSDEAPAAASEGPSLAEIDALLGQMQRDKAWRPHQLGKVAHTLRALLTAATERAEQAEAALARKDAEAFNHGYLIACCNLANLHNEPCMAADVLREMGITGAQVKAMDLSEYDAAALKEIRKARGEDPIVRAALAEKGDARDAS